MTRILVVGAGLIGSRHIKAVQDHPRCSLAGVVDPNTELASPDGVPRYSDISEVTGNVDAAIIATPTGLHGVHGQAAVARGWHILIEKPVASTMKDAKALTGAVEKAGIRSLVGHHRRYHPSVQYLKSLVETHAMGNPVTATMIWAVKKPDSYFEGNWRTGGGSPVMINLVHDIDLLRFVMGEVSGLAALPGARRRNATRIESGSVVLGFENGATAAISFADCAPSPWGFEVGTAENPNIGASGQDMLWITGTEGAVSFPSLTQWSGSPDWSVAPTARRTEVPAVVPLVAQLDHFLDVIDGAAPLIDVHDAMQTLDIALKIETALNGAQ